MTEAVLDIKQWGNNLHADQRVRVSVEDGPVVIRPTSQVAHGGPAQKLRRVVVLPLPQ